MSDLPKAPKELKDIPGFPGHAITKNGRVWSKPRLDSRGNHLPGKWLKPFSMSSGHLQVTLWKNAVNYKYLVHRLVLEAFVGPCPEGMECRHLDDDPINNKLENLRWGTRSENMYDSVRNGKHARVRNCGEKAGMSKLRESDISVIRYLWNVAKFSFVDIAWQFNVVPETISSVCHRKTWGHI